MTHMLRPVPSAQSLHAYRPLCNSHDKTVHDVPYARRFGVASRWLLNSCEQTRLRAFVLVGCVTNICLG